MKHSSPGKRIAAATGVCVQLLFAASAFAAQGDHRAPRMPTKGSAACEQARQFAWFMRGLRHGEGDNEPLVPAEPAECQPNAAHDKADAAGPHANGRTAAMEDMRAGALIAY